MYCKYFKYVLLFSLIIFFSGILNATDQSKILNYFKGLNKYSHKSKYSKTITDMYLAFGNDSQPEMGAAYKKFKTYKKVTALLIIEKQNGDYVVRDALIPDIAIIKDAEKQKTVRNAVHSFKGKVIQQKGKKFKKIDAITGATRYHNLIYATLNLLAKKIISEMEKNSDWAKTSLE